MVLLLRSIGVLFVGVGLLLMRAFDGSTVHTVGLGLWCFGVLVILDAVMMRDGLPAQILWGLGTGLGVYLAGYTDLADHASSGRAGLVISIITCLLGVAVFLRPPPGPRPRPRPRDPRAPW